MSERRCTFIEELLTAAGDEAAQRRLRLVLQRWAGQHVYLRALDKPHRPQEAAARLLVAGLAAGDAVRILRERTGRSERQCWRYLRRATDEIGRKTTEGA